MTTSCKRDIIILDCDEIKCPLVLLFVFNELCGYFKRQNYSVKIVTKINEINNNCIVFMGDSFRCSDPVKLLNLYAPDAIYIGWYWHNIDISGLKYFIYTYENMLNMNYDKTRVNCFRTLTQNDFNCPLLLRANEDPLLIGTYERNPSQDYCYMGHNYHPDLVPRSQNNFTGIYHGTNDHSQYLNYDDRKNIYLSSIFALGIQDRMNIGHEHVSQRIFEGMAYGCIVLSNSLPACEQTNNIVIYFDSLDDLENKMRYYKNNPNLITQKQEEGYEFIRKFGTNHTAVSKFIDLIERKYKIKI